MFPDYMIEIFSIKEYGDNSALNNFGFTKEEVCELCAEKEIDYSCRSSTMVSC